MIYALLVKIDMHHDGFKMPLPFTASNDDEAREIAKNLWDLCDSNSGWTKFRSGKIICVSENNRKVKED